MVLPLTYFKREVTLGVTIQRNSSVEHNLCPQFFLYLQRLLHFISHITYVLVPAHRIRESSVDHPGSIGGEENKDLLTLFWRENWGDQTGRQKDGRSNWG